MGCTWSSYVSSTLTWPTRGLSISSFNFHHLFYELFFSTLPHCCYNLISFVPIRPSISTSSFWSRNPTRRIWVKQAVCFDPRLMRKNSLQTNVFPNLVVVKCKEYPYALQRKTTKRKVTSKVVRKQLAGRSQTWLLECQPQLLPGHLGSRITLQYLAVIMQG